MFENCTANNATRPDYSSGIFGRKRICTTKIQYTNSFPLKDMDFPSSNCEHNMQMDNGNSVSQIPSLAPVIYRIYFKIASLFFLTPFTITSEKEDTSLSPLWTFKTSLFRKVVCFILHFSSVVFSLLNIKFASKQKIRENPDVLFLLFVNFTIFAYIVTFTYTVWKRQPFLLAIINGPSLPSLKLTFFVYIINFFNIIFNVFVCLYWTLNFFSQGFEFPDRYVNDELEKMFIKDLGIVTDNPVSTYNNIAYMFFIGITLFLEGLSTVVSGQTEMLVMLTALAAHKAASTCLPLVSYNSDIKDLLHQYRNLETFTKSLNRVVAPMQLLVFICIVSFLSQTFIDILDSDDWKLRCLMTIFYILYGTTLFLGAETNKKVGTLKTMMIKKLYHNDSGNFEDNNRNLSIADIKALPEVGLMCGPFFVITYEAVGTLILTIIMYSIIMVQFKVNSKSHCNCTGIITQ